jgi:hypothetical protein
MDPNFSHGNGKQNHAPAKRIAAASGGWMSEKFPLLAVEEKCFLLTSPFIEPAWNGCAPKARATLRELTIF